ncbi:lytic murein transglycosylase [Salinibacterium sp. ZJ454]|uniref:lytic transglycosylase domain-containing protein n=1 Tax=Salinibacterium sp. ZJ454 TaxID=2708339 RepID=UPI001FBA7681|nr:lytic murein transglycosylase [Salinibacterium sp. ZJ454]
MTSPDETGWGQVAEPGSRTMLRRILLLIAVTVIVAVAGSLMNALSLKSPPVPLAHSRPQPVMFLGNIAINPPETIPPTPAPTSHVDQDWVARVAAATGIPSRALSAYAAADLTIDVEQPACGLGWNSLAAIGWIESGHGSHDGAVLGEDGYPVPAIRGPALNGNGVAAIRDTDGGTFDGDALWDRAVGPMQFIPDTWARWEADGNGDGNANPNQIDDAALAAARYLCASGPMTATEGWRAAVFSYNHLDSYVDDVAATANRYAAEAAG